MSEENKGQGLSQIEDKGKDQVTETVSVDDFNKLQSDFQSLTETFKKSGEQYKKEIAGLNKRNSELESQLLSDEEQAKKATEEAIQGALNLAKETIVSTMELDAETAQLIDGNNVDILRNKAAVLKDFAKKISAEKDNRITELEKEVETLKANQPNPKTGKTETPKDTIQQAREDLIKYSGPGGDPVTAMRIKQWLKENDPDFRG